MGAQRVTMLSGATSLRSALAVTVGTRDAKANTQLKQFPCECLTLCWAVPNMQVRCQPMRGAAATIARATLGRLVWGGSWPYPRPALVVGAVTETHGYAPTLRAHPAILVHGFDPFPLFLLASFRFKLTSAGRIVCAPLAGPGGLPGAQGVFMRLLQGAVRALADNGIVVDGDPEVLLVVRQLAPFACTVDTGLLLRGCFSPSLTVGAVFPGNAPCAPRQLCIGAPFVVPLDMAMAPRSAWPSCLGGKSVGAAGGSYHMLCMRAALLWSGRRRLVRRLHRLRYLSARVFCFGRRMYEASLVCAVSVISSSSLTWALTHAGTVVGLPGQDMADVRIEGTRPQAFPELHFARAEVASVCHVRCEPFNITYTQYGLMSARDASACLGMPVPVFMALSGSIGLVVSRTTVTATFAARFPAAHTEPPCDGRYSDGAPAPRADEACCRWL